MKIPIYKLFDLSTSYLTYLQALAVFDTKNNLKTLFLYVTYGHMKRYIFRKDWDGFKDWIKSINQMRWTIARYKKGANLEDGEYTEANLWYINYLDYMKKLNENDRKWIKEQENHHIPEYSLSCKVDVKSLFGLWLEVVGNFKLNQLSEITNKEVGEALRYARDIACLTRVQVAKVVGIRVETLKAYENGERTMPFDVYYKLIQFLKLNIGILKIND